VWTVSTRGFPPMRPNMIIDTRAQATASGLPAALDAAARYVGASELKDKRGKALIDLFCAPGAIGTPQSHPDEWDEFIAYANQDIAAMRDLFNRTRQLPLAEWREYWAAENINDDGVSIDMPLVKAAANMAAIDQKHISRELTELTDKVVTTVNQVQRIVAWLDDALPAEGRDMLVKRYEEVDEEGVFTRPKKLSLTRDRVLRLIAYLQTQETLTNRLAVALRVLQIRLFGGSKTPAKFAKMLEQQVDGIIRNQYVFNGASQTGRFSARGVQVHNLMRDALPNEIDAIDALAGGIAYDDFAVLGDDTPVSRKLSMLIRSSFVASPGYAFCWGDWSNIEARLVPWLAKDPEAEARLDIFRAVDDGTEKFDIYTRTAANLFNLELPAVTKEIRQGGKVVELAAGFGGGYNALLSMAAGYGIHIPDETAKRFIEKWRDDNGWAVRFWGKHNDHHSFGLWGALNSAIEHPEVAYSAGRITYMYLPDYLGGSLMCELPSGRFLTYRKIRWERIDVLDDDDQIVDVKTELMFSRDMGRVKLWPGLACENVVQATAADILRGTLVKLDDAKLSSWMPVALHTHDEVVVETLEADIPDAAAWLQHTMEEGFDWSDGLPIASDTTVGRWYTKAKGSVGL